MPYETTARPKLSTRVQDKKILAMLRDGLAPKDVANRLTLSEGQIKEARRRQRLFYRRRKS